MITLHSLMIAEATTVGYGAIMTAVAGVKPVADWFYGKIISTYPVDVMFVWNIMEK